METSPSDSSTPSKLPTLDYRGVDSTPRNPRPISAGQISAWVSGIGFALLACTSAIWFVPRAWWSGLVPVLVALTILFWLIGRVMSIGGKYEAPEARSHERLGCSMAIWLLLGIVALGIVGFVGTYFVRIW